MRKKILFTIVVLSIGFSNLSLGNDFTTKDELNKDFFKIDNKNKKIKVKIKIVSNLNVIVKKDKNKILEVIEVKGSAAKDTSVGVKEKEIRIIAICDNSKW